jgi:hypothetical protein
MALARARRVRSGGRRFLSPASLPDARRREDAQALAEGEPGCLRQFAPRVDGAGRSLSDRRWCRLDRQGHLRPGRYGARQPCRSNGLRLQNLSSRCRSGRWLDSGTVVCRNRVTPLNRGFPPTRTEFSTPHPGGVEPPVPLARLKIPVRLLPTNPLTFTPTTRKGVTMTSRCALWATSAKVSASRPSLSRGGTVDGAWVAVIGGEGAGSGRLWPRQSCAGATEQSRGVLLGVTHKAARVQNGYVSSGTSGCARPLRRS